MTLKVLASHPERYVNQMQSCHARDVNCENFIFFLLSMGGTLIHQLCNFSDGHCSSDAKRFFYVVQLEEKVYGSCSALRENQLGRLS